MSIYNNIKIFFLYIQTTRLKNSLRENFKIAVKYMKIIVLDGFLYTTQLF